MSVHMSLVVLIAIIVVAFLAGMSAGNLIGRRSSSLPAARKEKERPRNGRGVQTQEPRNGAGVELYVGNLSYDVNEVELRKAFEKYGKVLSARIIEHRFGKSKGFGFVEMADRPGALAAIQGLHNKEIKGRKVVVNEAKSDAR